MKYRKTYQAYACNIGSTVTQHEIIDTDEDVIALRKVCLPIIKSVDYIAIERMQGQNRHIVGYIFQYHGEAYYRSFWRQKSNSSIKDKPIHHVYKVNPNGKLYEIEACKTAMDYFNLVMQ